MWQPSGRKIQWIEFGNFLKEDMQEHSVTMAVGAVWKKIEDNADLEFDYLLTEAEKLMYEDKDAYYKAAGIERRK